MNLAYSWLCCQRKYFLFIDHIELALHNTQRLGILNIAQRLPLKKVCSLVVLGILILKVHFAVLGNTF